MGGAARHKTIRADLGLAQGLQEFEYEEDRTEVAQNSFQCKRFSLLGNHILYSSTAPFIEKVYATQTGFYLEKYFWGGHSCLCLQVQWMN